jgi:Bacterial PH domain
MSTRRFPSKVDAWLTRVLIATLLLQVGVVIGIVATETAAVLLVLLATGAVSLWLIGRTPARTCYEVNGRTLPIVSGIFNWTIPLGDIRSVEDCRSFLSSPVPSLDRSRIRHGTDRSVLVARADTGRLRKSLGRVGSQEGRSLG